MSSGNRAPRLALLCGVSVLSLSALAAMPGLAWAQTAPSDQTEQDEDEAAQVEEIAKDKMPDLNCFTVESAMRMVAGTARSMGLTVDGAAPWDN